MNKIYEKEIRSPMSTEEWFWTLLGLSIPIIGFIATIICAIRPRENQNIKTFCRASLIIYSITIAIIFIVGIFYPFGGLKGFFSDFYVNFMLSIFM